MPLNWPGLVWRQPSVFQSCRWSKVPGCTKSGRSPPEGWDYITSIIFLVSNIVVAALPVFLVLSSCAHHRHICASSQQWREVASWPVLKRFFWFPNSKKRLPAIFGKSWKPVLNRCPRIKEQEIHILRKRKTWTSSTIPLQMTRLVGSRALLLKNNVWDNCLVSLYTPEIASYNGVAGVQEDSRSRDDKQEIVLCFCVDKPCRR